MCTLAAFCPWHWRSSPTALWCAKIQVLVGKTCGMCSSTRRGRFLFHWPSTSQCVSVIVARTAMRVCMWGVVVECCILSFWTGTTAQRCPRLCVALSCFMYWAYVSTLCTPCTRRMQRVQKIHKVPCRQWRTSIAPYTLRCLRCLYTFMCFQCTSHCCSSPACGASAQTPGKKATECCPACI